MDPRFLFLVWCLPPVSALLAGVEVPVICCPTASECWPELGADAEAVLRRTRARRRWQRRPLACSGEDNLYGSWCLPPGNGPLAGVGVPVICYPPVGECWPELGADAEAVLRRTSARRRWQYRLLACSGEDTPYGSWCLPPGNGPLTGVAVAGNDSPPLGECWPELSADAEAVLRRTSARRRWQYRSLACSGEDNPYRRWCFPPGNGPLAGVGLPVIISPPARECWPELAAMWHALLRGARPCRS